MQRMSEQTKNSVRKPPFRLLERHVVVNARRDMKWNLPGPAVCGTRLCLSSCVRNHVVKCSSSQGFMCSTCEVLVSVGASCAAFVL